MFKFFLERKSFWQQLLLCLLQSRSQSFINNYSPALARTLILIVGVFFVALSEFARNPVPQSHLPPHPTWPRAPLPLYRNPHQILITKTAARRHSGLFILTSPKTLKLTAKSFSPWKWTHFRAPANSLGLLYFRGGGGGGTSFEAWQMAKLFANSPFLWTWPKIEFGSILRKFNLRFNLQTNILLALKMSTFFYSWQF